MNVNDRVKFLDVSDGDNTLAPNELVGKIGRVISIEPEEFKPRMVIIHFDKHGEVKTLSSKIRKVRS